MNDILGHIAAQLAEFKALKEKSGTLVRSQASRSR